MKVSNICCTLRKVKDGKFVKCDECFIENIDKDIANAIIEKYSMGIFRDNSNVIIVRFDRY